MPENSLILFIEGLSTGSLYGLIGLAIVLVYRASKMVNFAQGEIATCSAYMFVVLSLHLNVFIALFLTLVASFVFGALLQTVIFSFIKSDSKGDSSLPEIIASLGLLAILNSLLQWMFGGAIREFPRFWPTQQISFLGIQISVIHLVNVGVALGVSVILFTFFKWSNIGMELVATSADRVSARLKGIPVKRRLALAWGMAAVIGAIAALLIAPLAVLQPHMMLRVLVYAFSAAVIGGLNSPLGVILGGWIVGVTENAVIGSRFLSSDLKEVVVFLIMVLILMFRPRGLFGSPETRRV